MPEQVTRNDGPQEPDPSIRATENVLREVGLLREVVGAKFEAVGVQFEAMGEAVKLLQALADKAPTSTDLAVGRLKDLHGERFVAVKEAIVASDKLTEERFHGIVTRFSDLAERTKEKADDENAALAAAFAASKELLAEQSRSNAAAVTKSEAGFAKQIDDLGKLVTSQGKTLDDKIGDLKDRLTIIESRKQGAGDLWALIVGGVLAAIAVVTFISTRS